MRSRHYLVSQDRPVRADRAMQVLEGDPALAAGPVGAENPVTLCDLGILVDQAAEPIPTDDPDVCSQHGRARTPGRRALLQRSVRPVSAVVIGVLAENEPEMPFAADQHPVQALAAKHGAPVLTALRDALEGTLWMVLIPDLP